MRAIGNKDFWLASLRHDGAAFRAAATVEQLDRPVPSCPDWTVADLVGHLGSTYEWVCSHVSRGTTSRPDPRQEPVDLPSGEALMTWWDERYATLATLLDRLDPEMPAWNWAPQAKIAAFWHRRMAHETAVHRWDAQMAGGQTEPIETKLAADGVAEVLDTWLPAGRRRGPRDAHGMVQLAATDIAEEWYVRLRGEGIALLDTDTLLHEDHPARVRASGTASDLVLSLYGRIGYDVLDVTGEASLLEALRTG